MVELINPYIFFIVNVFHHSSRKTSRWDVEAPEILVSLDSFKVSASVSEAATSRLGQNFERLGLGNMGLGSCLGRIY